MSEAHTALCSAALLSSRTELLRGASPVDRNGVRGNEARGLSRVTARWAARPGREAPETMLFNCHMTRNHDDSGTLCKLLTRGDTETKKEVSCWEHLGQREE